MKLSKVHQAQECLEEMISCDISGKEPFPHGNITGYGYYELHLRLPYTQQGPKALLLCSHHTFANKATKSYQALTKKASF